MKALALIATLVACDPKPVQPRVFGDDASDTCVQACAKLVAWSCPEGQPSPSGETCEAFCERDSALLRAACVASAATKADLATCNVRCR